jgi:hypothetical protein
VPKADEVSLGQGDGEMGGQGDKVTRRQRERWRLGEGETK